MGPTGIETAHGWPLSTIVAEADSSVALRVTPTLLAGVANALVDPADSQALVLECLQRREAPTGVESSGCLQLLFTGYFS